MKKNKILFLFSYSFLMTFFLVSHSVNAQQNSSAKSQIIFSSKQYKEVLASAKANHKKIFVDAYATWCEPCKALRKTSFKDGKAAAYYNKNFVNISVDVEKGEGVSLSKTWNIEGLPTLLILDENGRVVANHVGYIDGNGLLEFAKEASGKQLMQQHIVL